jgi:hypothetical protein
MKKFIILAFIFLGLHSRIASMEAKLRAMISSADLIKHCSEIFDNEGYSIKINEENKKVFVKEELVKGFFDLIWKKKIQTIKCELEKIDKNADYWCLNAIPIEGSGDENFFEAVQKAYSNPEVKHWNIDVNEEEKYCLKTKLLLGMSLVGTIGIASYFTWNWIKKPINVLFSHFSRSISKYLH